MTEKKIKTVLVINGPNLNLLGTREPDIYGSQTLDQINERIMEQSDRLDLETECFQSNHEGDIVDKIGDTKADAIVINPAAFTHTSVALRDALSAFSGVVVEVHLSNILAREDFRHKSLTAGAALGLISGFGSNSYLLALEALKDL